MDAEAVVAELLEGTEEAGAAILPLRQLWRRGPPRRVL